MNWLIPLAIAAQLGDLSTTAIGLHRGCQEVTYPVKNEAGILAMKGSALGFTLLIYPKLHREHAGNCGTVRRTCRDCRQSRWRRRRRAVPPRVLPKTWRRLRAPLR